MLRRVLFLATSLCLGCSSGDFEVADTADSATLDGEGGTSGETGAETAPGPCDPEPEKAKYCIEVKLAGATHPPYTSGSGAVGLNIDGKGRLYVAMWDKDPTDTPTGMPSPEPTIVVAHPSETGELSVDTELPATISGSAPPGTYTVMSIFADNLVAERPKGTTLPGDFVVLPTVSEGKLVYPKMKLENGKVQKVTLELRPNRKVSVSLGIATDFYTYAKTQPTIHGDGPVVFGMFDGTLGGTTSFLSLDVRPCIATNIQTAPTGHVLDFTTTIEGTHNVYVALIDYAGEPNFPGKGSLTTKALAPYPTLDINPNSWTASATVDLTAVHLGAYPSSSAPVDSLTCK